MDITIAKIGFRQEISRVMISFSAARQGKVALGKQGAKLQPFIRKSIFGNHSTYAFWFVIDTILWE
jgi:hypothetical protein